MHERVAKYTYAHMWRYAVRTCLLTHYSELTHLRTQACTYAHSPETLRAVNEFERALRGNFVRFQTSARLSVEGLLRLVDLYLSATVVEGHGMF